ncbi:MAG TPA: ArsA-related P-loop ATPase [Acidimicrobiales bacterium]|nr:ArsA-related P-loop ATPase [Acidimicrobiales bacterium]
MDRATFVRQSNVLVIAGKGGVGKTTVAAALARMAADAGLDVLVVALDSSGALPGLFGVEGGLSYEEEVVHTSSPDGTGRVRARVITPDDALLEYLEDHGLRRVAKRLVATGVLDVVATAIPGIREILVLGKVKQLERAGDADVILLDAPATGHAVRFLTSATGLMEAARGGPLRSQAADVVEMLHDPARAQVMLVTLPEETPVNELVETAFRIEDEVGVLLTPVVVNACYEAVAGLGVDVAALIQAAGAESEVTGEEAAAISAAAAFRRAREQLQQAQLQRLAAELPLPQLRLPYAFHAEIGPPELEALAEAMGRAIEELPSEPRVREAG